MGVQSVKLTSHPIVNRSTFNQCKKLVDEMMNNCNHHCHFEITRMLLDKTGVQPNNHQGSQNNLPLLKVTDGSTRLSASHFWHFGLQHAAPPRPAPCYYNVCVPQALWHIELFSTKAFKPGALRCSTRITQQQAADTHSPIHIWLFLTSCCTKTCSCFPQWSPS